MNDLVKVSAEEISAIRLTCGEANGVDSEKLAKKILSAETEFVTIPESGQFAEIDSKEFDLGGDTGKKLSIGLKLVDGGFVSENSIFASTVTNDLLTVKNGANKDSQMLLQSRISEAVYKENSQNKRLASLQGMYFRTEKIQGKALKLYTPEAMFRKPAVIGKDISATLKNELLANVEPKTYYKFVVSATPFE